MNINLCHAGTASATKAAGKNMWKELRKGIRKDMKMRLRDGKSCGRKNLKEIALQGEESEL